MKIVEMTFGHTSMSVGNSSAVSSYDYSDNEAASIIERLNEDIYDSIRLNELNEIDSIDRARHFICTE